MPRLFPLIGIAAVGILAAAALAQRVSPTLSIGLPKTAAPKSTVSAKVKVVIPSGWHAYQNPPSKDYQIPLTVEAADKTLKGLKITYPKGEETEAGGEMSAVYNGTVEIPVTFTASSKPGKQTIKLKVSWQMCDAGSCQPPSSAFVTGQIMVAKPGKGKP